METGSGVLVGSKEGGTSNKGGLGLRMQEQKESCCTSSALKGAGGGEVMMVMSHHGDDEPSHELLLSSSCSGGLGEQSGDGIGGAMFCGASNRVAYFGGDIYDVVGAASGSASGAGDATDVSKGLHHYNFSDSSPFFTFSSLGEMTPSLNMRVPFTAAQFQEFERQTTIYKYMMASIPVPPELLIPITKSQSNASLCQSNMVADPLKLGISSSNLDPEPWRCKRTDGKKWRCSRDVAHDQKYCERHSHKSRPRSRKPVELHTDPATNTITSTTNNTNTNTTTTNNNYVTNSHLLNQKPYFAVCTLTNCHSPILPSAIASSATAYDQPRSIEWFFKGETVPVGSNSSQDWQHLKRGSGIKSNDFLPPYREEQLNSTNLYMNLRGGHSLQAQRLNDQCSLLSSHKATSLEAAALNPSQTLAQETRHFLDARSTAVRENRGRIGNKGSVPSSEKPLPPSSLTLSMSGGSEINEDNDRNAQEGSFGIMGSDTDQSVAAIRPQWMAHGSWMSSPPGGPLAEALGLGISSSANGASSLGSPSGITAKKS